MCEVNIGGMRISASEFDDAVRVPREFSPTIALFVEDRAEFTDDEDAAQEERG